MARMMAAMDPAGMHHSMVVHVRWSTSHQPTGIQSTRMGPQIATTTDGTRGLIIADELGHYAVKISRLSTTFDSRLGFVDPDPGSRVHF